jgi:hypothetical protein
MWNARDAELKRGVPSRNKLASEHSVLLSCVFPSEMTTIKDIELVLGQRLLQTVRVGNWNEWIISANCDLAGYRNLGETLGEARKRLKVIANESHCLKETRPGVRSEVIQQHEVGKLVFGHILKRAADQLFAC